MDAKRYTQPQVLCGLREAWEFATGIDEWFDAETQIYAFMRLTVRGTTPIWRIFGSASNDSLASHAVVKSGKIGLSSTSQSKTLRNGNKTLLLN